jgi:putative nucleotidyltransferase with HDIG domain
MLAQRTAPATSFTRRDAVRLVVAVSLLVAALTAILSIDLLPQAAFRGTVGDLAPADVYAPRAGQYTSAVATAAAREAARRKVEFVYGYSPTGGQLSAAQQLVIFERTVAPVDAAFGAVLSDEARQAALSTAIEGLSPQATTTLQGLDKASWTALRTELERVLDAAQRQEVRDTELPAARAALASRASLSFPEDQRALAGTILQPLLVANSSYDAVATGRAREQAAAAVGPVTVDIKQGELIVQAGARLTEADLEKLDALGVLDAEPDRIRIGGWFLLAVLTVALILGWVWRFRPVFWHRNNALLLIGLFLVAATLGLKLTADRSIMPFFVPLAAAGLLTTILLDAGAAVVLTAIIGVLASVVVGSVELGVYVVLGGLAGIVAVRRGERLQQFAQAAALIGVVGVAVVGIFGLLGDHDLTGTAQLMGAALAAAIASTVVAVGSFAVLGNLFGFTTSFQLLELANPSQPLLRRLLLETAGTYHHSLMVGNLSERAAEAIGADPLLVRVAAYYHDVGKLANPDAFIENQAGGQNVHDELPPEESAAVLKSHVASGIDLAYEYRLPKPIIAFIPQHHGTAVISYFHAKAQEAAIAAAGARPDTPAAQAAAATVDVGRFRHSGPKPQSREAAILMLADGVEASVRSLTSQDEPAIRAMVDRIIRERLDDGQFDECDLTLRDVEQIREAFVAQLLGMYHRRIAYPQSKIVELESRRAAGGGGSDPGA